MSDETKPEDNSIPPRVTIKVPGQSGDVSEAQTAATLPGNKKKTARISLDQTTAEPGATQAAPVGGVGYASKTIRLAPAMTGQVPVFPPSQVGKVSTGAVMSEEAKRATSRIPLEAILSQTAQQSAPTGMESAPKTIKVKRPTISIAPKVTGMPVAEPVVAPPVDVAAAKSQTARVELAPEEVAEPQQTQKKTIKIRRAEGAAGEAVIARRMTTMERAEAAISQNAREVGGVPAPHWIFPVTAAVAMLVLCFLIYLLSAQAFPNLGWSI